MARKARKAKRVGARKNPARKASRKSSKRRANPARKRRITRRRRKVSVRRRRNPAPKRRRVISRKRRSNPARKARKVSRKRRNPARKSVVSRKRRIVRRRRNPGGGMLMSVVGGLASFALSAFAVAKGSAMLTDATPKAEVPMLPGVGIPAAIAALALFAGGKLGMSKSTRTGVAAGAIAAATLPFTAKYLAKLPLVGDLFVSYEASARSTDEGTVRAALAGYTTRPGFNQLSGYTTRPGFNQLSGYTVKPGFNQLAGYTTAGGFPQLAGLLSSESVPAPTSPLGAGAFEKGAFDE